MHKHLHVALGERGLLPCDRINRDARFGNDPLTIAARDFRMFGNALGFKAMIGHA